MMVIRAFVNGKVAGSRMDAIGGLTQHQLLVFLAVMRKTYGF